MAWQKKGIEYGTTCDAMIQLVHTMEKKKEQDVRPALLLQADQFGILHAPSGHARGFLMEYDYHEVPLYLHHSSTGQCLRVTVGDTSPSRPFIRFG